MGAESVEYVFDLIDKYSPQIRQIIKQTDRMERSIKKTNKSMKTMQKSFKNFGTQAKRVGKTLSVRVTAPIVALGTTAAVSFARLESGLININNLLSKAELKTYGVDLKRLQEEAVKAGFSIDDVNKGLFDNISALGASEASFKAFQAAQKLAIGGATTLGRAVDGITTIMSVYKDANVSAIEAANAFFSAQVKGKTTVEQLSTAIGQVAPIASAAGVGFKELLATMSALTVGGLSTDEAATSLKGAITALVKPPKEATKFLKKMGIIFGAADIQAQGLSKTLESLAKAQKKYGLDALAKAIPNVRALTGVTALNESKIALLNETIKKINSDLETGDGLMRAFTDQNKSMALEFAKARGKMTIAMKKFGKEFAPQLKGLSKLIGNVSNKFADLSPHAKKITLIIFGVAAVIPPLIVALGAISFAIGAISAPVVITAAAVGTLTAAIILFTTARIKLMKSLKDRPFAKGVARGFFSGFGDFGGTVKNENNNKVDANVDVTFNTPKGIIKQIQTKTKGKNFKLGTNMVES